MGSSKQKSSTTSSTAPWQPTQAPLEGLLGSINSAGSNLGPNVFQPQMTDLVNDLFAGGPDRTGLVEQSYSALNPIASGANLNPLQNPIFQQYLDTTSNDIRNSVNSQFASAGRDLSPEHLQALSRGVTQGTAPAFAGAYDSAANRQLGAIGQQMQGAGLLSNLDASQLERRGSGVGLANQVHALPLQNQSLLSNLLIPIAGLGSQGQSNSTQTTQANPYQVATGGILGGLGLMSGGTGGYGYNPFSGAYSQPNPWMAKY